MSTNLNINAIEKKVWLRFFEDGLWDIYLGLLLLIMGIPSVLVVEGLSEDTSMLIYIGIMMVVMGAFWAGKRFITRPRIGTVKLGEKAKQRRNKARILLLFSVVLGLVIWIITSSVYQGKWKTGIPLEIVIPLVWMANMLIVFWLGAYFLEYKRLYLIGLMYAVAIPVDSLAKSNGIDPGYWVFVVPASVILIVGTIVLVKFMKTYQPLPASDESEME